MLVVARPPPGVGAPDDIMLGLNVAAVVKEGERACAMNTSAVATSAVSGAGEAIEHGHMAFTCHPLHLHLAEWSSGGAVGLCGRT